MEEKKKDEEVMPEDMLEQYPKARFEEYSEERIDRPPKVRLVKTIVAERHELSPPTTIPQTRAFAIQPSIAFGIPLTRQRSRIPTKPRIPNKSLKFQCNHPTEGRR